jgi:hypothetical protein
MVMNALMSVLHEAGGFPPKEAEITGERLSSGVHRSVVGLQFTSKGSMGAKSGRSVRTYAITANCKTLERFQEKFTSNL